jgi:hypothetical protein
MPDRERLRVVQRNEHLFATLRLVVELPPVERVEQYRRSVAMLPPGAPALNRERALQLYADLIAALLEVRRLRKP